jgi:DNA-binding CsgD family transcriptional regulator
MKRTILIYGLAVAAGTSLLTWIRYRHFAQSFTTEIYVGTVAVLFGALGIWVGSRLGRPAPSPGFQRNDRAIDALGISPRELEVLELLAEGHPNKEIARRLFVSANTIKTHLARLYEKLEVSRRTQAIHKARSLSLIR